MGMRVREMRDTDRAFVENAWRSTMLALSPSCIGADPGHFHGEMTRVFERLLPHATTLVACDAVDEDTLAGFACFTGVELHYVYVAGALRKMGIVPTLLDGVEIRRYTFRTPPGERRLRVKERGWLFTPRFAL